jgi:uncharacterized protein YndB with AHSA1/START domain
MSRSTKRRLLGRVIDTSVRVRATPEQVWEAWADPEKIAAWFVDRAEGVAEPGAVMTWIFDAFNYRVPVPIVEAEPGRTFVTGSGDEPGPHGLPYVMEITISKAEGDTVIRLVNSGFSPDAAWDDEYEGVVSGWAMALGTLKVWLERYAPRPRAHRLVVRPQAFEWQALAPLVGTVGGRRRWLDPVVAADAPVLVDSGREVLLDWPERQAVLGLKAFTMGPGRMIGVDFSTWAETPADLDALTAAFEPALDRLAACLPPAGI